MVDPFLNELAINHVELIGGCLGVEGRRVFGGKERKGRCDFFEKPS